MDELDCRSIMELNNILAKTILQDGFSPPVASRIYAYTNIAAYEVLSQLDENEKSFTQQLNGFEKLNLNIDPDGIDPEIAVITAFSSVAKKMVYTYQIIEKGKDSLIIEYSTGMHQQKSELVGNKVAEHILKWMKEDNYGKTRNMPLYTVLDDPSKWRPTPPTFGESLEPHWPKIRPFTLRSADQFAPKPPLQFSSDTGSAFYQSAFAVYEASKNLNDSLYSLAKFWDCNPMPMTQIGHMVYVRRQLTPGGHWVKIAQNACKQEKHSLMKATKTLSIVSITLADAFISCWDEKYRSNLIRPETYIKQYIDKDWKPLLETPLFPEHTSGHSVISTAAAVVLTHLFGENYRYTDNAEEFLSLKPKQFNSFKDAARTAAISRFYGGIHYMPAIEYGVEQGDQIGEYVWNHLSISQ